MIRVARGWDDQEGQQDPKTDAGVRDVPLIGRVRTELMRHKLATGRDGDDLVFGRTHIDGFVRSTVRAQPLRAWGWKQVKNPEPTGPKKVWIKAREDTLDPLTPHEARHTAASHMAGAGLTPKEAQEAMGHADIRTTLNIYAKAVPGWQEQAAAKLDAYLDGGTVVGQSRSETQWSRAVPERLKAAQ